MIDYQRIFHIGVRVPSLEAAMSEYGEGLGVTWAEPRDLPAQSVWTPERGLREVHLKFTYSAEGPQHLELLEGEPGSPWYGNDAPGAHHLGIWVDDIVAETERLAGLGWKIAASHQAPEDGYGVFTYLQPPSGLIVELVDQVVVGHFEQWWAAALG
jgi:lactoylglutathione lyase